MVYKILKTIIINLPKIDELSECNRKRLKQVQDCFNAIDTIHLYDRLFNSIKYNPSNKYYEFIINICKLIKDNLLIDEKGEESQFYNFLEDENKMTYPFKNFVRNFYKKG